MYGCGTSTDSSDSSEDEEKTRQKVRKIDKSSDSHGHDRSRGRGGGGDRGGGRGRGRVSSRSSVGSHGSQSCNSIEDSTKYVHYIIILLGIYMYAHLGIGSSYAYTHPRISYLEHH